ncbi:serine/threonine-protein kinase [Rheinheimera maricola]|uniref:Serine/threonine protein kinase n=1 Tax=Rheinheimera maricola TaxID=2793282 RepID=A0ABS7X5S9_9GAMM|nr:serine/threonine-protein kinase [Rheinheimera maricola]MBZ9610897.1 serine/threonine protein kinase [Rheinheimera maricola]
MTEQDTTSVDGLTTGIAADNDKTRYAVKATSGVKPAKTSLATIEEGMLIKQRYLLESKIGSGGMSDIYRATDLFLQKAGVANSTVAIKVLQQQFVDQPEALQLLLQEAHKTQQLSHPNIVRVFDVDCDQQHYFIVMECLDGESLEQVIKRYKPKGLPLKSALKLLHQIAEALNFAHKTGIVHADLKPANIMVNRAGEVKVLDFGVSQKLQLNHDIYAAEQQSQTAPLSGYTPAYASPQLLSGNAPCVADDLFSFACLSYELLTSKHPFERLPADKAHQQNKQASKPAHLNILQWQALKQALQFDALQRKSSISKLMRQFSAQLWQPAAAAAAVLVICSGGWQYYQQNQTVLNSYQQRVADITAEQQKYQQLADGDVNQLLSAIARPEASELQRNALLRQQQNSVITHFEQQIDQLISDRSFAYPNYPEIEKILAQASALYPDSHYLAGLSASMLRSKQTAIDVLRSQLNQLLLTQQYQKQNNAPDLYTIQAALKRIDASYVIEPYDDETASYIAAFDQAIANNNAIALQQLIMAGELLFAQHQDTAELVTRGQQLAAAVDAMASYHSAIELGKTANFPYQAAELFYQHSFSVMSTELAASEKAGEIDAVYDQLQQFSSLVPTDFSLHVALRRKLADKYLSLSGQLLQSNQVRTAERLMRRANELMSSINS